MIDFRHKERRCLPDRRSGYDRRVGERRQSERRKVKRDTHKDETEVVEPMARIEPRVLRN